MPGRQYKLANGLYGLIRGGLPIGGLSSPAPVIWVFPWALCKVNGIRPDKRQLVRDREAHRRGVVRRPVQQRGFRGLFCMALIDPAFTGSIEGSASKVYPGDFPGLKERHSFCLCGSSGGIGRFPCAFWKALLSWLGCCNNRRIKAKRKGLPLLFTNRKPLTRLTALLSTLLGALQQQPVPQGHWIQARFHETRWTGLFLPMPRVFRAVPRVCAIPWSPMLYARL